MDTAFTQIRDKIKEIQFGILRHKVNGSTKSWQVKAVPDAEDGYGLVCVLSGDIEDNELMDQEVNLIQKYKNDYVFITGKVIAGVTGNLKVVFLHVLKASCFERRGKGAVSWLKEKYTYENLPQELVTA